MGFGPPQKNYERKFKNGKITNKRKEKLKLVGKFLFILKNIFVDRYELCGLEHTSHYIIHDKFSLVPLLINQIFLYLNLLNKHCVWILVILSLCLHTGFYFYNSTILIIFDYPTMNRIICYYSVY